jgi:hypothetical protein
MEYTLIGFMRRNVSLLCIDMEGKDFKADIRFASRRCKFLLSTICPKQLQGSNWEHEPFLRARIRRRVKLFTHSSDQDCVELYLHAP